MLFDGKVAVVTGAEACAKKLASEGATVVVADINDSNGERVVAEIRATGAQSSFVQVDVSSADAVAAMVRHAVDTHGGLHLAVNDAGLGHSPTPFHEIPIDTFDHLLAVNVRGVILCMRQELAQFVLQGTGGAIVNMASVSGLKGSAGMGAYVATKHAVVGITRTAGIDYADRRIRVNAVAPGPIITPAMRGYPQEQQDKWVSTIPMGRMGTPEDIAEAVSFLLSDKAAFVTASIMEVDGGYLQAGRL